MGSSNLAPLLISFLVFLIGCSGHKGSGEIVYVGWNDLFVIDMAVGEIVEKVLLGTRINDIELTNDGRLLLATARGIIVIDSSSREVIQTVPIGILDSIEYDDGSNTIYALFHPGTDPDESKGPHKLLKLSGDDFLEEGALFLEPWTYDIFLSPSGDNLYVTHTVGRSVLEIDTANMTESRKLWFGEGEEWEGRMVIVRHLAFSGNGSSIYVLEQGAASPTCLWIYSPETGEMEKSCLEEIAKIQGMEVSPDGSRIFANGLEELVILDSEGGEISRTELDAMHRWIALSSDAGTLYMTADLAEDEGQITCIDIHGNIVRKLRFSSPVNVIAVQDNRIEGGKI
jgi:DNA-binding beta-propeller fold protein YncE